MDPRLVRISKRLSRVLRHVPDSVGIRLDQQGWVRVDELLTALTRHGAQVSRAELDEVVAGNDKQRFALRADADGTTWIRASQGHSARVTIDLGLTPRTPPERLFHGTQAANLDSIMVDGLHPGRRHHVHLSPDAATATAVGRRRGSGVVVLTVRAAEMADAGHVFYRSDNGVWLTEAVPATFIRPPTPPRQHR